MTARILVVDDEPDLEAFIRQKFRHQIRDGAVNFLFACDGVDALAVLKANHDVDMLVVDINMPRMDGLTLLQKLQDPGALILPINRSIRAVTKDGRVITGRRLNEDTWSVQLIDSHENLVGLMKADLKEYTVVKTTTMPTYKGVLSDAEIGDVAGYLLSLKALN